MATFNEWVQGARPRTLPVAVSPVAVGTGAAYALGETTWGYALLALVVALCLQVGVNYANDYSDGIRGTDSGRRAGRAGAAGGAGPRQPDRRPAGRDRGVLPRGPLGGSRSSR